MGNILRNSCVAGIVATAAIGGIGASAEVAHAGTVLGKTHFTRADVRQAHSNIENYNKFCSVVGTLVGGRGGAACAVQPKRMVDTINAAYNRNCGMDLLYIEGGTRSYDYVNYEYKLVDCTR